MIAPIDEVAEEEMEIDDGEGAGDARAEPRVDEPGDGPPPPRPREVPKKLAHPRQGRRWLFVVRSKRRSQSASQLLARAVAGEATRVVRHCHA